jgi:hypothetical protein
MYAYVTCRVGIGYAIAELAKFANTPAECHYSAVRPVFLCFLDTKQDGIFFWRSEPRLDLPDIPLPRRALYALDATLPYAERWTP